jgi:hypothetical protein
MDLKLPSEDFKVDNVYKLQCAMDESDRMYFLNSSEVCYDDIVSVEFHVWILNNRSHEWTKDVFGGGYERFILQTFLKVYRDKLYLICLDKDKKTAFISVNLENDCYVTVLKYIDNQYVDVTDTTVNFFDYDGEKLNKIRYYCIKRDEWTETPLLNRKITLEPNMKFILSNDKIFTRTRVYDLSNKSDVISIPNCRDKSFRYVCKTNLQLGFTVENDFNILYLLSVIDFKWTRIHLPSSEKFLNKCIVCFSWDSSRIYFARFNDDKSLESIKLYYHSTVTSMLIPFVVETGSSSNLDNDIILSVKNTDDSSKTVDDSVKQQQVCATSIVSTRPKRKCTMKRKKI